MLVIRSVSLILLLSQSSFVGCKNSSESSNDGIQSNSGPSFSFVAVNVREPGNLISESIIVATIKTSLTLENGETKVLGIEPVQTDFEFPFHHIIGKCTRLGGGGKFEYELNLTDKNNVKLPIEKYIGNIDCPPGYPSYHVVSPIVVDQKLDVKVDIYNLSDPENREKIR